jgi:tetratricopeptide (TPR) repeat protein
LSAVLLLALTLTLFRSGEGSACDQARHYLVNYQVSLSYLDSAWNLLSDFRVREPSNETALELWVRLNLASGDNAADQTRMLACYRRALAAADTLRQLDDGNPMGHMWWAAARGKIGLQEGMLNSLGMLPSITHEMERALELDSNCSPAYTGLGALYRRVAGIFGGDRTRSRHYLEAGLRRFPNATDARLELARLAIDEGRWSEARQQLDTLIATADPLDTPCFVLCERPEALKMLRQIGR